MRIGLLGIVLTLTACGSLRAAASPSPTAPSSEVATCERAKTTASGPPAAPSTSTLAGVFTTTAGDLAQQQETSSTPGGPHLLRSDYRDYPADTPIVLCYFDGPLAVSFPAPASGAPSPVFDRALVTVDPAGKARLVVAGDRRTMPLGARLP